jgi:uncharacterized protein YmfQ (DUF2313 family)
VGLDAAAYARQLKQLLPQGVAWSLESGSRFSKLLLGLADELARVDARGGTLIDECDPRTTLETLTDWERVYGLPDTCVVSEQSVDQRRAALVAKVIALGGQTPAYFIALAAAMGFAITVTEFTPHDVEDDCDQPIDGDDWAYAWQVNAALGATSELTVDDPVDEALTWWGNTSLECVMRRLKPAHTYLLFSYS